MTDQVPNSSAVPIPLDYSNPAFLNPMRSVPIDWASFYILQIAHRFSSIALLVFVVAIAAHVKQLSLPPTLPLANLLAGIGLGSSLIGFLVVHARRNNLREATGLIFFSLFLIIGIISFRIITGVPLTPLPGLPF